MTRCDPPLRRAGLALFGARALALLLAVVAAVVASVAAAVAVALLASTASAQSPAPRQFPPTALRGEMVVTQAPDILLNRRPAQLAPGARIRGVDNLLLLSGSLTGQRLVVHYTLDPQGQPLEVWVLSAAELARRPWPSTPEQAQSWLFNADAQTWSPR
jgi:hypothetical protein